MEECQNWAEEYASQDKFDVLQPKEKKKQRN